MTELPVLVASLDRLSRVGLASVLDQQPDLPEAPGAGRDWIAVDLALRSALSASAP